MKILHIAVVDDEKEELEKFKKIVVSNKDIKTCKTFESGETLLEYIKENQIDAIFLDIHMPVINGIELAKIIMDIDKNIDIVFLTSCSEYAVDAFELNVTDYIIKPLTKERLAKTMQRLSKTDSKLNNSYKPFIQCFGEFEVFENQEALTFKNSKAKELLAFLVHRNGVPADWEKIVDAIWPDYDSHKAQTNFHATNYLLRKRLEKAGMSQIIESARGNYRIIKNEFNCDLYQLENIIKNNEIKTNEDMVLINKLMKRGYMEASGYEWSNPKAAELNEMCVMLMKKYKNKN